jgi:hypothetical protein
MKPKAFKITIPTQGFSKHDEPGQVAFALADMLRKMFHIVQRRRGESCESPLPFDINMISVEAIYDGPRRGTKRA